jgi:hypothetical protein
VTLYGLGQFTKCQQLLEVRLNFRPILPFGMQIPSNSSKVKHIKRFVNGSSFQEDELVVGDVVEFLVAVFPDLESLQCPSDSIIWAARRNFIFKNNISR